MELVSVDYYFLENFVFEEKERDRIVFVKLMEIVWLCFNESYLSLFISYEKIGLKESWIYKRKKD